jgi:exosortase
MASMVWEETMVTEMTSVVRLLQECSTWLSYTLFKLLGIHVVREGFLLHLPNVTMEVGEGCSGIRSSAALLATCLLAAGLFLKNNWHRALFVALAIPLAILKNGIRIVILGILGMYVHHSFLDGSMHRNGGIVVFGVALLMLAPVLSLLQRSESA